MNALAKLELLAFHVLLFAVLIPMVAGDDFAAAKSDLQNYETQLNAVLRTRFDEEKAYVHEVIELVQAGKLPRKLVDKSFLWVRKHHGSDNHSFVYFERVLRLQATTLRFQVPAFDYDVYDASNR